MDINQNEETYNKIAQNYFQDHKDDTWDDDFLEDFLKRLGPGSSVLDLGCGPGIESEKISRQGMKVFGLDISEELLKIAREKVPSGTFLQKNMLEGLPYPDGFFDGIFAKASLLHVPKDKIDDVIGEMKRAVKNGGIIHIAVKKGDGEQEITENDYGYEYKRSFSFWQPEELETIFKINNLNILNEKPWQNPGKKTIWLKYILQK